MAKEAPDLTMKHDALAEEVKVRVPPHIRMYSFWKRLTDAYGWRFTAMACIIYGANGLGETFISGAENYYFFDIQEISAARYTQITGFARIPWEIKALYGMTSDNLSFCGLRRTPYLIFSGFIGACAGFSLWTIPVGVTGAAMFLTMAQLAVALADVMIDGSSGEKAHLRPDLASDLQAAMHSSSYIVGFVGDIAVGYLVEPNVIGSRGVFGLFIITALSFLTPAAFGWLQEDRKDEAVYDVGRIIGVYNAPKPGSEDVGFHQLKQNPMIDIKGAFEDNDDEGTKAKTTAVEVVTKSTDEEDEDQQVAADRDAEIAARVRKPIFVAAVLNSTLSFILGVVNLLYAGDDKVQVLGSLTVSFGIAMTIVLYFVLSPVSLDLAKAAIYIFLEGAFHPTTSVIFQWSHSDGENGGNCSGNCDSEVDDDCGWARSRDYPCIEPALYGWAKAMARIFGLLGVVLYATYFSTWRYKQIFAFGHAVYFLANMLDLVWVTRTNISLGINDELFLFGSEIIQPVLSKLHTMPILILSAKLCPKSVEATLFALMMGVWNFGSSMGKYNGVALLYMFGGVEQPQFKNLEPFIFVRTLMFLGPLLLVPVFAPNGGPNDGDYYAKDNDAGLDAVDKALKATQQIELTERKSPAKKDKAAVYAKIGQVPSIDDVDDDASEAKESPTEETDAPPNAALV